jgi:hypothetical protein
MNGDDHQHHRKKNSQVIINPNTLIGGYTKQMTVGQQQQNSATILYTNQQLQHQKEKESDRILSKNVQYRMDEPEDKAHKRQQSLLVNNNQPPIHTVNTAYSAVQPLSLQNPNAMMNFKALAKPNGSLTSQSTTPTSATLPQSNNNNLSTVNK